jgi:hypothetical protein
MVLLVLPRRIIFGSKEIAATGAFSATPLDVSLDVCGATL